jgi:murein L,D-transpeptidase YafK
MSQGKSFRLSSLSLGGLLFWSLCLSPLQALPQTETSIPISAPTPPPLPKAEFPAGLVSLSNLDFYSPHTLVVDKSKRLLRVYEWRDNTPFLVNEFPADIGKKSGDKTKENDHRTPVGIYFLQRELTQPEIPFNLYGNLAFTMDYPNIFDQRQAKTGYGIWLHAVPDNVPLTRGSRGCVVVRNDVIKNLRSLIKLEKTPILIFDSVSYLNEEQFQEQRKTFLTEFENWRKSWESQDVDTYIKYYADNFRNDEMNFKQWYNHKKKLKGLYSFIKVDLSEPLILVNKDMVVIRTMQRYQSNLHQDYGEKTIHAKFSKENGFQIIREAWRPMPDPFAKVESSSALNGEPVSKKN